MGTYICSPENSRMIRIMSQASLFIGMYLALMMTQPALRLINERGRG